MVRCRFERRKLTVWATLKRRKLAACATSKDGKPTVCVTALLLGQGTNVGYKGVDLIVTQLAFIGRHRLVTILDRGNHLDVSLLLLPSRVREIRRAFHFPLAVGPVTHCAFLHREKFHRIGAGPGRRRRLFAGRPCACGRATSRLGRRPRDAWRLRPTWPGGWIRVGVTLVGPCARGR